VTTTSHGGVTGRGDRLELIEELGPDGVTFRIVSIEVAGLHIDNQGDQGHATLEAASERAIGLCEGIRWALSQHPDEISDLAYEYQEALGLFDHPGPIDGVDAPPLRLVDRHELGDTPPTAAGNPARYSAARAPSGVEAGDDDRPRCVTCGDRASLAACDDEDLCHSCAAILADEQDADDTQRTRHHGLVVIDGGDHDDRD